MKTNEYINCLLRYPSAWEGHANFAINLVKVFNPKVTVDLGVDYGFSTFCLAYENKGETFGIDWFQGDAHAGYRNTLNSVLELYSNLKITFDIPDVTFVKGDFNEIAKVWTRQIDILHIDGLHTFEAVKLDYQTWSSFCNYESVILFHDVESFADTVGKFFNELDGYKLVHSGSAGLGVFTKSKEKYSIISQIINTI